MNRRELSGSLLAPAGIAASLQVKAQTTARWRADNR